MLTTMRIALVRLFERAATALIAGLVLCWPAIALAQTAAPPPNLRTVPAPWIGLLVMGLLLVMVVSISLMPSKRTHQD
jgi:hypothetical protein